MRGRQQRYLWTIHLQPSSLFHVYEDLMGSDGRLYDVGGMRSGLELRSKTRSSASKWLCVIYTWSLEEFSGTKGPGILILFLLLFPWVTWFFMKTFVSNILLQIQWKLWCCRVWFSTVGYEPFGDCIADGWISYIYSNIHDSRKISYEVARKVILQLRCYHVWGMVSEDRSIGKVEIHSSTE